MGRAVGYLKDTVRMKRCLEEGSRTLLIVLCWRFWVVQNGHYSRSLGWDISAMIPVCSVDSSTFNLIVPSAPTGLDFAPS